MVTTYFSQRSNKIWVYIVHNKKKKKYPQRMMLCVPIWYRRFWYTMRIHQRFVICTQHVTINWKVNFVWILRSGNFFFFYFFCCYFLEVLFRSSNEQVHTHYNACLAYVYIVCVAESVSFEHIAAIVTFIIIIIVVIIFTLNSIHYEMVNRIPIYNQ